MVILIREDEPGWRPSWADLLDVVERYCHEEESAQELRWLRGHPTDWLMAARYLRIRTEDHVATTRKGLASITVVDEVTGQPRREYLRAKAQVDTLNKRRMHWMSHLDEQIVEAKYLLGWDKIPNDLRAQLIDRLISMRTAVLRGQDAADLVGMIDAILVTHADEGFDPGAYIP